MRKLVYAAILGLLFLAPVKRLDVANLQPVQTDSHQELLTIMQMVRQLLRQRM